MAKTILISKEEFEDLVLEVIDSEPYKHDTTLYTSIFEKDGSYWMINYMHSYNWGIDDWQFPLEAREAYQATVTTTEWKIL